MHDYIVKSSTASKVAQKATHIDTSTCKNTKACTIMSTETTDNTVYNYKSIRDNVRPCNVRMYEWVHGRASRNIPRNVHRHRRRWQSSVHQTHRKDRYCRPSASVSSVNDRCEHAVETFRVETNGMIQLVGVHTAKS